MPDETLPTTEVAVSEADELARHFVAQRLTVDPRRRLQGSAPAILTSAALQSAPSTFCVHDASPAQSTSMRP